MATRAAGSSDGGGAGVVVLGDVVAAADAGDAGPEALHAARVAAGWPAMGAEVVAGERLAAEIGLVAVAVNLRKGCYPGQELVERMDSRGAQAPRRLCQLEVGPDAQVGDPIVVDGAEVGRAHVRGRLLGARLREARCRPRPPRRRPRHDQLTSLSPTRAPRAAARKPPRSGGPLQAGMAGMGRRRRSAEDVGMRAQGTQFGCAVDNAATAVGEPGESTAVRSQAIAVAGSPTALAARATVAATTPVGSCGTCRRRSAQRVRSHRWRGASWRARTRCRRCRAGVRVRAVR